MTGYELIKYFDGSVAFVWNAPHSQIYPELRRMERDGLVDVELAPRGERATKRIYSINEAGLAELQRWAREFIPYQSERDPYRLKAAHFEQATYEAARHQLQEHVNHFTRQLQDWKQMVDDLEARRVLLLQERLARRPEDEHEAIIAFRKLAFKGQVARARAEIQWAKEGLALLDELESKGASLRGESADTKVALPHATERQRTDSRPNN
jgi:DNA-binding PadR family transcriptional regulator